MFNSNNKDRQEEFFSDLSYKSNKSRKGKLRLAKITLSLSYENITILSIGLIMLLIACYSLGVEKGKRLVQVKSENIKIEQEQVQKEPKESAPKPQKKKVEVEIAAAKPVSKSSPYIQVATFCTDKYAKREEEQLKISGYQSFVISKGKFREVCVGGYKNKNEAVRALRKLRKVYADCFLREK